MMPTPKQDSDLVNAQSLAVPGTFKYLCVNDTDYQGLKADSPGQFTPFLSLTPAYSTNSIIFSLCQDLNKVGNLTLKCMVFAPSGSSSYLGRNRDRRKGREGRKEDRF